MSNLGDYQKITTAAKAAGGVAPYVAQLERAAALRAAPGWVIVGTGIGVIGMKIKQWNDRRLANARQALANQIGDVDAAHTAV